jgi:ABC-type antimicrobial peptide transport system permease subunit
MFSNYLKIAWRNIARHKVYTCVNTLGLALGICACISIYVIISYELSFDNFYKGKNRIYRVVADVTENTGEKLHFARLPQPVLQAARNEITGLDNIAGYIPYNATTTVPGNKTLKSFNSHSDGAVIIAEPQFFDIFAYNWLAGNATTALLAPGRVVLTESKARKYFGATPLQEIIGKQLLYNDSVTVSVSGIIQDRTENSDLAYTDFISFSSLQSGYLKNNIITDSWAEGDLSTWIFVKLTPGEKAAQVNVQLAGLVKKYAGAQIKLGLWLEPLRRIHFNANIIENPIRTADMDVLYILMAAALFILLLGVINFINLSTAQFIRRAKETGIRKVLGSSKNGIALLFLTETLILTLFAVVLAAALVKPVLAAFRSFIPAGITFHLLQSSTFIFLLTVLVVTTVLAGLYPAKVLSSYLPAISLKGAGTPKGGGKWILRKGLTIFQFSISLVFVIGSIVITKQLNYAVTKFPGFTADAILTVDGPRGDSIYKVAVLAQKIKQLSGINGVALQWLPPMTENSRGMRVKFTGAGVKEIGITQVDGDENYIPLYKIKLLAGRNLMHTDTVKEFVINESLLHLMGYKNAGEALGKILYWNNKPYPVIGVAADFHTASLHDPITPLCIVNRPDREGSIAIKLALTGKQYGNIKMVIARLEKTWKQIYPSSTFNYRFYDETLAALYDKDRQTATLVNIAMAVTIFISCIGLFGLALFTTQRRAKEISIRKILGATIPNITAMLTKQFAGLIFISLLVASPIAWYLTAKWLQGFAYHINISLQIFVLAGVIAMLIMAVTIGYQTIKAAIANPVKNLRTG